MWLYVYLLPTSSCCRNCMSNVPCFLGPGHDALNPQISGGKTGHWKNVSCLSVPDYVFLLYSFHFQLVYANRTKQMQLKINVIYYHS